MDLLKTKLKLLSDLSGEHQDSINCLKAVNTSFLSMVQYLEHHITLGNQKKKELQTKIGLELRESLNGLLSQSAAQINEIFLKFENIYATLLERQVDIEEIFQSGLKQFGTLQTISNFISDTSQRYELAESVLKEREYSLKQKKNIITNYLQDKENRRCQNHGKVGEKYKLNMLIIAKEGNQNFIQASRKNREFQIEEISNVIDKCIESLSHFQFIDSSAQINLGIDSRKGKNRPIDEIDLLCNQDISMMPLPIQKKSFSQQLHRISEKKSELETDSLHSQTKMKKMMEATFPN